MTQAPEFNPGVFTFETRRLVEQAQETEVNGVWSYAAMTELVGHEIDGSSPTLQAALKRLSRDHGIEFKNVRNMGYLRLDESGIVEMAPIDRQTIRRRISRAAQRTGNIKNWEALTDHYKREADTHRSLIAVMRQLLKPSAVKRIRDEVDRVHDKIDVDGTLALFRSKSKE